MSRETVTKEMLDQIIDKVVTLYFPLMPNPRFDLEVISATKDLKFPLVGTQLIRLVWDIHRTQMLEILPMIVSSIMSVVEEPFANTVHNEGIEEGRLLQKAETKAQFEGLFSDTVQKMVDEIKRGLARRFAEAMWK